jgi:hypothetical protein
MSTLIKIFTTILILYTFIGKLYTTVFYFRMQGFNLSEVLFVHFTNITMLLILLASLLMIWWVLYTKINYVISKYKYIFKVSIVIILVIQILLSLLDILTKNPNINQLRVFILGDLPNLLSIFISIIFIIVLPSKKYLLSKSHGN